MILISACIYFLSFLRVCLHVQATICTDGAQYGDINVDPGPLGTDGSTSTPYILIGDGTATGIGAMNCYGTVKKFEFYCLVDGAVTFQVWRQVDNTKFRYIGGYETDVICSPATTTDRARVFNNINCGGSAASYFSDSATLFCNGCVSSVNIRGVSTWRFYDEQNYQGNYVDVSNTGCRGSTVPPVSVLQDNRMSSLQRLGVLKTVTISSTWEQIPIRPGDYIAMYQSSGQYIPYTQYGSGSPAGTQVRIGPSIASPTPNGVYNFPTSTATDIRRKFPFRITLGTVFENIAIGTEIFQPRVVDENADGFWQNVGDEITFAKGTGGASLNSQYFNVDTTTGLVTTAAYLDYETLKSSTPHAILEIIAYDGGLTGAHSSTATLTITVQDINDEKQKLNLPASVTQDARTLTAAGNNLYQIQALFASSNTKTDGSTTCCDYLMLSLDPSDGSFSVEQTTGYVQNTEDLSNTKITTWNLEAVAVDKDGTFTSDPYVLTITLTNVKTPPRFDNLPGTADVREDVTIAQEVFPITAVDLDNDIQTTLATAYSVSSSPSSDYFDIQGTIASPVLFTKTPAQFDFETTPQYILNISVSDQLNYTAYSTLVVNILDINEVPDCFPSSYTASMEEKTPVGTLIGGVVLNATDSDTRDFVTWSIESGANSDYFTVSGNRLYVAKVIDVGTSATVTYTLQVKAVDTGGLYCNATVTIIVKDVNDPHTIVGAPANFVLDAQTTSAGTTVTTISATPAEAGDIFTYTLGIPTPSDGLFSLDERTGVLTTTRAMNNIQNPTYQLPIIVTDDNGLAVGPEYVTITVINMRRRPTITNLPGTANIGENTVVKTSIFTVSGTDADGDLDPATYNIDYAVPSSGIAMFQISQSGTDGLVETVAGTSCDYESGIEYTLVISVKDTFPFTSEQYNLTVVCTDVNEEPHFNITFYTVSFIEEQAAGTVLELYPYDLDADDPDVGQTVTYQILSGTNSHYFIMSGNKIVIHEPIDTDPSGPTTVTLSITVRDPFGLSTPNPATVVVTIVEINDHTPKFAKDTFTGRLPENSMGGTSILTIAATDGDLRGHVDSQFSYSINDTVGDEFFQIASNGLVSVKHQIDFDKYPLVVFEILATDKGTPALTGTTTVSILVEDISDGRPTFVEDFFNLEIPSDTIIGTDLLDLNATDVDSLAISNITFNFLKYDAYYNLDGYTGELTVSRGLINNHKYLLYFVADDNGNPPHTSNVAIARVDTFSVAQYSVDIHLAVALSDYETVSAEFHSALGSVLKPWRPRVYKVKGEVLSRRKLLQTSVNTKTVVSVYAVENNDADTVADLQNKKQFVPKSDLLGKLRKDLSGTPSDILKTTDFADFLVTQVEPTRPVWLVDTIPGILVLCLLILVLLAAAALITYFCCRRDPPCGIQRCARKKVRTYGRPLSPSQISVASYKLNYKKNEKEDNTGNGYPGDKPEPIMGPVGFFASRKSRRVSTPPKGDTGSQRTGATNRAHSLGRDEISEPDPLPDSVTTRPETSETTNDKTGQESNLRRIRRAVRLPRMFNN